MAEIEDLFAHSPGIAPDPKHSMEEDRLIAVGRASTGACIRGLHDTDEKPTPLHPSGDGSVYAR